MRRFDSVPGLQALLAKLVDAAGLNPAGLEPYRFESGRAHHDFLGPWRNWQTRWSQKPLSSDVRVQISQGPPEEIMLWIKQHANDIATGWHLGDPVPEIRARVVTLQADGDELDCLLDAMKKTQRPIVELDPG